MSVLRLDTLPLAVLSAERLNGTVFPVGMFFAPLIGSDTRLARLSTALVPYQDGVVFSGRTAAWVWGVLREPRLPIEYSVDAKRRMQIHSAAPHQKRELCFSGDDVVTLSGYQITTPLRTVFDLLLAQPVLTRELRVACRLLLTFEGVSRQAVLEKLEHSPRIPHTRRLRERLQLL